MLNSATKSHNEELIVDLGPIAYAISTIVGNASPSRADSEKKTKFWTFLGMALLDAQISDIRELEPSKKEPSECMNLSGFNAAYDRKKAQEDAWQHVEKSTTPCIF